MLTFYLCSCIYVYYESERFGQAIDLEDSAVVIAPLIPWSIAGAVPLATINAPTLSLAAATFLYLLPLSRMLASAVRRRSGFLTRHRSQNQNTGLAIPHRPKPMLHMFAHGFHPKSGD